MVNWFRVPQDPVRRVRFWLTICACAACVFSVPLSMVNARDWVLIQTANRIIVITPKEYNALFWPAFWRFEAIFLLTLAGIMALVWLVLRNLLQAVTHVNEAARSVREGAFDEVHLREDAPGQLSEVSRLLNDMAVSLRMDRLEEQRALGEISHELRTPLASIYGYAQLMNMDGLTPEQRQSYARVIEDESQRLHRATDLVLRLSELQSRDPKPGGETVRVDEVLRQLIAEAEAEERMTDPPEMKLEPIAVTIDKDILTLSLRCLFDSLLPDALAVAVQCAETHGLAAVAIMVEQDQPQNLPSAVRGTLESTLTRCGGDLQEAVTAHIHAVQLTLGEAKSSDRSGNP